MDISPAGGLGEAEVRALFPTAYKTADEARDNDTLADDGDLQLSLDIGIWEIEAMLYFEQVNPGGGVDTKLNYSGNGLTEQTILFGGNILVGAAIVYAVEGANVGDSITNTSNSIMSFHRKLIIELTSNQTVKIQWAQNTTNASALTLKKGSILKASKIS
jgi:hypothetical protein